MGFLFLVLYPLLVVFLLPVLPPHSHTLTHSLPLTYTHSLTHTLTHSHSLSLTHLHSPTHTHLLLLTLTHSLTHSHSLTLTYSHTHTHPLTLTHTHTLTLTHSHSLTYFLRGRHGTMCAAKGSDVRPGAPLTSLDLSAAFAWQAWDNVHCQGVGCMPRVPLVSRGFRLFCVVAVGPCALIRGRMYGPGFRWRPWVSASFAWQA